MTTLLVCPWAKVEALQAILSDKYLIETLVVCSSEYGQPTECKRRLTWMRHKQGIVEQVAWPLFAPCFRRACELDWCTYLWASSDEVTAAKRKAWARLHHTTEDEAPFDPPAEECLTSMEAFHLQGYKELFGSSQCVVALNQNPREHPQHNAIRSGAHGQKKWTSKQCLQTVIKNAGTMWSLKHGRWILPDELVTTQCFPPPGSGIAYMGAMSCYDMDREAAGFGPRLNHWVVAQVGNGMNVNVIGIGILHVLFNYAQALQAGTALGGRSIIEQLDASFLEVAQPVAPSASQPADPREARRPRKRLRGKGPELQASALTSA